MSQPPRVALATCAELPDGDPDDAELARLLGATFAVWDDPAVDWSAYDLVVVRSTWDYSGRRAAFVEWAQALGDRLCNPPEILRWNTDKSYLAELAAAGLAVVPTRFAAPGEALAPCGGSYVIKPTVSAGSRDTARYGPGEEDRARALVAAIHASGRTAMVQPYIASVDAQGETALLYFDGEFSHAIRKGPLLAPGADPTPDLFAAETIEPQQPSAAERALAAETLVWVTARFGAAPAYARVDLVTGDGGTPLLLELELTEPSLFLAHAPGAAERFAGSITRHLDA